MFGEIFGLWCQYDNPMIPLIELIISFIVIVYLIDKITKTKIEMKERGIQTIIVYLIVIHEALNNSTFSLFNELEIVRKVVIISVIITVIINVIILMHLVDSNKYNKQRLNNKAGTGCHPKRKKYN